METTVTRIYDTLGVKKTRQRLFILVILLLLLVWVSFFLGRYSISPTTIVKAIASRFLPLDINWSPTVETVIFQIRLPRILLALIVGAGLSISGAGFQGVFQNPLVGPSILGVSSSAGFGAAFAILMFNSPFLIQVFALAFGILGVIIAYTISRVYQTAPILMLVLSGIVVSAFFSALISVTKFVADPYDKLPEITFWLMGSLGAASLEDLLMVFPPMLIGITGLLLVSWKINILSMGDKEARALGVNAEFIKIIVIACATMVTASAVCVSGIIGWVGLIIPHIGRMIVGPDHRILLPVSLLLGAIFLLLIDDLARTIAAAEIPLGILTALIGAPFFIYLIRRTKGGWK
ncbi:iron ABC transporter permease [bacterium]|nr:iron ABC transporter permease [bacterium]